MKFKTLEERLRKLENAETSDGGTDKPESLTLFSFAEKCVVCIQSLYTKCFFVCTPFYGGTEQQYTRIELLCHWKNLETALLKSIRSRSRK